MCIRDSYETRMDSTRDQMIAAAAKQLLSQAKLSASEINTRITNALSPDYWRQLNAALCVARRTEFPAAAGARAAFGSHAEQFDRAGYFQTAPIIPLDLAARLKAGVDTVRQNDWPAVFVYVYDEFWQVARSEPINSLLETLLGPGYRQNCHVWGHC